MEDVVLLGAPFLPWRTIFPPLVTTRIELVSSFAVGANSMPPKAEGMPATKLIESVPEAEVTGVPKGRYERPPSPAPVVKTPPKTVVDAGVVHVPVNPRGTGTPA
jgi:hypothetical protein